MFQYRYYILFSAFAAQIHHMQAQLENLALHKEAMQSSTNGDYIANMSVDGNIAQTVGTCSHTLWPNKFAWWQVDLNKTYGIQSIKIYHRDATKDRLNGFQIIINTRNEWQNVQPCYSDTVNGAQPSIVTVMSCKGPARYVRIYNAISKERIGPILEPCEVQVFGCAQNKYGDDCKLDCNCKQKGCFFENGTCFVPGCEAGWHGKSCNKSCDANKFGADCNFTCHCLEGSCNRSTGVCDELGCKAGWKRDNCSIQCNSNQNEFGFDCNSTCHCRIGLCNVTTGVCNTPGCKAGWKGDTCSAPCEQAQNEFGFNCNSTCHCNVGSCDVITGVCNTPGCKAGWIGNTCSTPCMNNTFGVECNNTCHCKQGSCENTDGQCFKPGCKPGWKGHNCSIPCDETKNEFGFDCNSICHCSVESCNVTTGVCNTPGCKAGWKGDTCSAPCMNNTFGVECNNTCHCKQGSCENTNGQCFKPGCKPGWKGNNCSIPCDEDFFESNCSSKCYCKSDTCDPISGKCNGDICKDGWTGETCSKKCENGTFGYECATECHCLIGVCHNEHGACPLEGCKDGWKGTTCSERIPEESAPMLVVEVIVSIVAAVLVIAVIVIGLLLYKRRRRPDTYKQKTSRKNLSDKIDASVDVSDVRIALDEPKNQKSIEQNETEYENLDPRTNTNISFKELKTKLLRSTIKEDLEKEYKDLKNDPDIPTTAGQKEQNKDKNRFLAIFPYDHSRVILETLPGDPNSDYINANYIDGVNGRDKSIYVAAQGPKTVTVVDFWRMIWQIKSGIIVMLANPIEKGKMKCFKYWPDVSKIQVHGDLKIALESEVEGLYFTNRQLKVTHKKTGEIRNIHHLHFTTWPDHGTPDPTQLVLFHRNYMQTKSDLMGPPVVHCSAGVGRTGTFIALDALYKYGKIHDTVDVFEYVKVMRKNRMTMVQTAEQYVFVYKALMESFEFQETSLSKEQFIKFGNQDKRIKAEFRKLMKNIPKYDNTAYKGGMEKCNLLKNRSQNILPVDKFRPYLMSHNPARSSYINAVMIPSYKEHTGFLVTQFPLLDTVVDFWCLVYDHESPTVVTLDCSSENEQPINWIPTDKSEMQIRPFSLRRTKDTTVIANVKETQVCLVNEDNEKIIKVFEVQGWRHGLPSSGHVLLKLIEMVDDWRTTARDGPITVVCMDGAKCCGLFCALYNIIQKLRYEDNVDIYQTVKQLQVRRPEFFSSVEQYQFFYSVVREYIENANIYVN